MHTWKNHGLKAYIQFGPSSIKYCFVVLVYEGMQKTFFERKGNVMIILHINIIFTF